METLFAHNGPKAFWFYSFLSSILFCVSLYGESIQFERIPNELGLSQNFISCLYQDRQGFLWVGTKDGLNRFDGYQFKVFRSDAFDSTTLSHNFIKSIIEDRSGRLWIGTANGLNLMDREQETFSRIMVQSDRKAGLSRKEINDIAVDKAGNIWVITAGGGLNKITIGEAAKNTEEATITHFPTSEMKKELWPTSAKTLEVDRSDAIWVHGYDGLFRILRDSGTNEYHIDRITWDDLNPNLQVNNIEDFYYSENNISRIDKRIYTIFKGIDDQVWVETAAGLAAWDSGQQTFQFQELKVKADYYSSHPLPNCFPKPYTSLPQN